MARLHLTDLAVRKLPHPERGQVKYWDTQTAGFGILVGKNAKSYFASYGKERRIETIARYGELSLSEARKEAMRINLRQTPTDASYPASCPRQCLFGRVRDQASAIQRPALPRRPREGA